MDIGTTSLVLPTPQALGQMPREERNAILYAALNEGVFDYLDFGTHKGGGIEAGKRLGGRLGLGVELSDEKVVVALNRGFYVLSEDVFRISGDRPLVDFAICRHVLEHMPNIHVVALVLGQLKRLVRSHILIEQPDFSQERYLYGLGLKLQAFFLKGHDCPMSTRELIRIFWDTGFDRFALGGMLRIRDSDSSLVHRSDGPNQIGKWRPGDLPKPQKIVFDRPIYRDIVAVLGVNAEVNPRAIAEAAGMQQLYFNSEVRIY